MSAALGRGLLLGAGVLLLFAAAVVILLRLLPGPHSETDYLIIGCLATFVALGALFAILITTWLKRSDTFYKSRRK